MQKVWKAIIGRIKGKGGSNLIDHLKVSGILITDKKTKNKPKICLKIKQKTSSDLQRVKIIKEKDTWTCVLKTKGNINYNVPFSITGLK